MIKRYSSRREPLSDSLFNKRLKDAKNYDRIAGYFNSSILEVAGEYVDNIDGRIRVVCNSDLDIRDVKTARAANNALRREWCKSEPEKIMKSQGRFKKLYELLSSGKIEVKVLPNEKFGLIHGKAGVITFKDDTRTSFLGSANESLSGWKLNYELVWEDSSKEAVEWVQEEFDSLWNDETSIPLCEFIIEDIKRISEREIIESVDKWKKGEPEPAEIAVESPVYREQLGLWEHQKYFVDRVFYDHKKPYCARYILADQVGLGKTIQLAMSAQLMALYGDKPILIIVPKTLIWQWQDEMNSLLDMPSAVWDGKCWVDEEGHEYVGRGIRKCPRRIGVISQGLIVAKSQVTGELLEQEYECVIVDEAHRARRRNLGEGKEDHSPDPNNLYRFLLGISIKTKSMLLATATPIQMYPIELWDLMNILSRKNDSVLGSLASYWRKRNMIQKSLDLIMGKEEMEFFNPENWEWIRNPFPPGYENTLFASMRLRNNMKEDEFVYRKNFIELSGPEQQKIGTLISGGFYEKYNPYIRHVIRRERKYLEDTINPDTREPYLQRIGVRLFGEEDEDALLLNTYLKEAYNYAEEFCKELSRRNKGAGFLKTLLLKRIGSSIEAGKNTGNKMLNEWNIYLDEILEEEDFKDEKDMEDSSEIKNLTKEETELLIRYVKALESSNAVDPKYEKTVELLRNRKWLERGTIIFSQYYDTARWIAEKLSFEFPEETIGVYAGGTKSGIFKNGEFFYKDKETIKAEVKARGIRILVGTDAASEGLNLQTLGSLINIDLPWNPTRLEQRKGRIQRIGQEYDTIYIYNMRYKDSIEDRVHKRLSQRLKHISDIFGQVPDTLEDVWIKIALGREEEAMKLIDEVPDKHPFENRYNRDVKHIDWESCSKVLDNIEKRQFLKKGW